ncbi:DUF6587 family protein [Noviherbaspirillum autotrophicum]|nr:DUF6587 family protein [Noviherbaspirillum autotrophicum]
MQEWIVGVIVAAAFLAVVRRYMPKVWRRALRIRLELLARRLGWERLARRLAGSDEAAACSDGCSSCGGCGTDDAQPVTDERFVIKLKTVK